MTALVTFVLLPLVWSAVVFTVRAVAVRGRTALSDTTEKAVLGLMLLPLLTGMAILVLPVPAPPAVAALLPHLPNFEPEIAVPAAAPVHHGLPIALLWPRAALAVWAAGAGVALFRLGRAHVRFARIALEAEPEGDGIYVTPAAVPAFAWNRRRIVVPQGLRDAVSAEQFGLITAHERAHQARNDPMWFRALGLVQAAIWFNPFLHFQARACRLAAELACDAAVTRAAPDKRRLYAEALLRVIAGGTAAPATVPALSDFTACKMRLETIMTPTTTPKALLTVTVLLVLAVPAVAAEIAVAKGAPAPLAAVIPAAAPAHATVAAAFRVPVDGAVSDGYGMRKDPFGGQMKFHEGIDFIAPVGTPVKASAAGRVSFSGERWGFGTVVEIDHGDGMKTRYAHLSRADVKTGDAVDAGRVIGAVGTSGKSTPTPHLHFEIWKNGKPQNPAPFLGLDQ